MTQVRTQLTAQQVADRLDVTSETVRAWARTGRLDCIRHPSGRMRFRVEDIEAIERGERARPADESTAHTGGAA